MTQILTNPFFLLAAVALFVLLCGGLGLNKAFVPQPFDETLRIEASATRTANFNGTPYNIGSLFSPGGVGQPIAAVAEVTAADRANSDETYAFVLEESADGGTTWAACGPSVSVDASGTSATLGTYCVPGFVSYPDVRLRLAVGGTTPSITYNAVLTPDCVP